MDPYLYALISTFVPEHFSVLTELAGGLLIKEIKDGKTYANGVLHSFNDEPTETIYGIKQWYKHGVLHRDNDLPSIICPNGYQIWFQNGDCHRDNDLPAIISRHCEEWYQNGRCHRDNGPAIIRSSGSREYWRNGKRILCNIL